MYWAFLKPERKIYFTLRYLQEFEKNGYFTLNQGSKRPKFLDFQPEKLKSFILFQVKKKHYWDQLIKWITQSPRALL